MGTFEMKWGKVLAVGSLVALGVGVLLINLFWVPDHDALMYAFGGMSTTEQSVRVASIGDIIRQQMHDYVTPGGNGRVFVHGLCAFFMGFKLYTLFKLLNTAMWILFTWLVLRTGGLTREKTSLWGWAFGASVVWWVCWYGETAINAAFAMNYLWTATATLILFALWKRLRWWMVPFAFLYGWSQECFVLPALVALGGSMVVRSIVERRRAFTWQQVLAWLLIFVGACFLCLAPSALVRAERGIPSSIVELLRAWKTLLFLAPLPIAGMAVILWRKWRESPTLRAFVKSFLPSLEWWLYFAVGVCLMQMVGAVRTGMPAVMALLVLLVQERRWLRIPCRLKGAWVLFVLFWVGATAWFQCRAGQDLKACLARYDADPQGITWRAPSRAGFCTRMAWSKRTKHFHQVAWMLEAGRHEPMNAFAPWLYHMLYLNPQAYFAVAEPVPGTPCFFASEAPLVLVAKGEVEPTQEEYGVMERFLTGKRDEDARAQGVRGRVINFLRLGVFFQRGDYYHQSFPHGRFSFVAHDGKRYTVFAFSDTRSKFDW